MTLNVRLSGKSIADAAKQLRQYAKSLDNRTDNLLNTLGEKCVEYANLYLEHDDTGATRDSIQYAKREKEVSVTVGGAAVWIEFGTGCIANAGNTPHPKRDEVGAVPWGEYGKGYGKGVWEFPSRYYGWIATEGIPMNPFMYKASQSIRSDLNRIAKEAFKID